MDDFLDLYEVDINAECDQITARLEKYRVKQTAINLIPQKLTLREEKSGYSHKLYQRVPVAALMKVQMVGFGGNCNVHCYVYCLEQQKAEALKLLIEHMSETIQRRRDQAAKLAVAWKAWDKTVKQR